MEERDGKIVLEKNREGGHDGQAHRRPLSQNPPDAVPCVGEPRQFQLQLRPRLRRSASASASASCVPGCPRCRAFTAVPLGSGYDEASSSSCCCCPNWVSACGKSKTGSDVARLSSFPSLAFPPVPLACGLFFFFSRSASFCSLTARAHSLLGTEVCGGEAGEGRAGGAAKTTATTAPAATDAIATATTTRRMHKNTEIAEHSTAQHSTEQNPGSPLLPQRGHTRDPPGPRPASVWLLPLSAAGRENNGGPAKQETANTDRTDPFPFPLSVLRGFRSRETAVRRRMPDRPSTHIFSYCGHSI